MIKLLEVYAEAARFPKKASRACLLAARYTLVFLAGLSFFACRPADTPDAIKPVISTVGSAVPDPQAAWIIYGPIELEGLSLFESGLDRDYLAEAGGAAEEAADFSLSLLQSKNAEGPLWRNAKAGLFEEDGYSGVDFIEEYGSVSHAVAYAYREIEAAQARRAVLKLGSDDGVKVFLNGHVVLVNQVERALVKGEDAVSVELDEGKNRLLVKLQQAEGEWAFLARFDLDPATLSEADSNKVSDPSAVEALALYPDRRALPAGLPLNAYLMTKPASSPGSALVELKELSGATLVTVEMASVGRFTLNPPAGAEGVYQLTARGLGGLAAAAPAKTYIIIGDARELAAKAVSLAREEAAVADGLRATTLEFLARSVEGKIDIALNGGEKPYTALRQIWSMTQSGGGFPEGLWRHAYTSALDSSLQPFTLYVPDGYDRTKRYSLIVALHGASGNDYDYGKTIAAGAPSDFLIVSPYGRGDLSYTGAGERDVLDVLDLVEANYSVDPDRIYISGSSMGGFGTWRLAQLYPWRFAAALPFAGWTSDELLENIKSIPILAVHGDADDVIPYDRDLTAISVLRSLGGDAGLDLMPGVGHSAYSAWTKESGPERLYEWFRPYSRTLWPLSLSLRTTMARTGKAAWAAILGLSDGRKIAALDVKIAGGRRVEVETENVSAFELDLRHSSLDKGGRILIAVDGYNLTADSGKPDARFEVGADGRFRPAEALDGSTARNSGSGVAAIYEGPLRVIYGTQDKAARALNEKAAHTMAALYNVIIDVELQSDGEADKRGAEPNDGFSRLFIGDPDSCPSLKRLLKDLPFVWKDGFYHFYYPEGALAGKASSLVMIHPDPERPGRLFAVFSLSLDEDVALNYIASQAMLIVNGMANDPCGFKTPDAMFFHSDGTLFAYGFFDWRWRNFVWYWPSEAMEG